MPDNSPMITVAVVAETFGDDPIKSVLSVIEQDYKNIELIIVDNGMPGFDLFKLASILQWRDEGNPRPAERILIHQMPFHTQYDLVMDYILSNAHGSFITFLCGNEILLGKNVLSTVVKMLNKKLNLRKFIAAPVFSSDGGDVLVYAGRKLVTPFLYILKRNILMSMAENRLSFRHALSAAATGADLLDDVKWVGEF